MKKGLSTEQMNELKQQAISSSAELSSLNYTYENLKQQRKEQYQKIYKNQLGIEI
ncbi:hypothetical protein II654_01580 [bacterium]|nr:hypothetical protein [bacterium]